MADFRKPAQGALKAIQAASKAADEQLAKMLSHSGDKALPLVLPRANPSNDFINQQAERVARQMMGEHVTTGKDTTNLAGRSVKESQRVKGLDYKLSPTGTVAKEAPYIPRKGDVKVAFPGDQTVSNKTLDEVNGFPIDSVQEGGAYYGLGQRHLADPEFWKSTETPAKAVQGKVDRVAELYQPERVIGSHLAMGQMSNNFAMHFADANLRAIDWSKAKPNKIDTFDSIIAYGYKDPKTGEAVKFPNWPGLADREGALAAMKEDSNLRKWFNNRMKTPTITKPLGLPNGLDIQYAITEPRIRDMEINMTGLMTGELKPKALVEAAGNPHNTYTHRILGEAGGPQEVLSPFVIDFPDAAQHIASTKQPSDFTGTIQKVFPHQIVDDQYINQYNQYRQRIKELTGQKKGGAVERKETVEEMDKFHKCFNMHKAFGGAVVKKAEGGAMLTPTKKTQGFEEEKPMDKSVLEKMHKAVKEVPKLPTSPLGSALNLGYEGYKYFSGKDPVGNFQRELNRKLNPKMDTGSAPVQEFEKFAKGGRVQESPEEMARFHKCFAMHKAFGGAVKKPQKFDNGGIASPSDEVNQGAAFGIYQKPKGGEDLRKGGEHSGFMAELLAKMAKDQGKEEVSSLNKSRAATDLLNRGVLANNPLSATVDMFNAALMPLDVLGSKLTGRDIRVSSEKPFLGSEYVKDLMNQYGVTSGEERPMMETALSFASPAAMIKGAMKATDAAKKAPELMKKASDAFTSSKMSPLATEAKTASAGKPTGATYATKQEGPFFRVSPTTLDTSKAKTRGIREADELQSPAPLGGGAGSTGRETPQLLSSEEVGRIIADPVANEPLNIAKKYTQETQGVDFAMPNIPESSLAKQSAIGRAQQLAVEGSPEYKTAVFDAYAKQMPDVLEQAGAKNYDDLMEKAYRQMAKETDDQFKILPYNFSYHRAGEGNYNGAMDMASDVHGNKHLYVYQGGDKHDFLNRIDPASGLNENEKFRAVHDLLGHAIYGNQFGPKGEEMAWAVHSQMYSPLARLAMTAETRGQNSMVNYSPLNANLKAELAKYDNMANEARRKGDEVLLNKINAAKRQAYAGFEFAPNKAVLLPPEFLSPQYAGGMPDYLQAANRPAKGTETQSVLTHFSNDPNLQMLDPKRYGTGIKGAEAERLRDYAGGVKDRSYFYMGEPGLVAPEAGLGVNRYRGEASSLYDITQDPLNFQTLARESNRTPFTAKVNQGVTYPLQDANDIERLVKEYGYEGMANPKATKPMAIMFKETPVRRQARGGLTLMK